MPAIVIIDGREPILTAARACARSLGADLRELPSVREAVGFATASGPETEAFIFGPAVNEPIQGVQQLHAIVPEAPVLVLATMAARPAVTRGLQFSPFVSSFVRCSSSEAGLIGVEIERAVRDYRRRRKHKATIASLNQQLSLSPENVPQRSAAEYLGRLLEVAPIGVISADFLRHAFEPFRQQDASATRAEGGLGLGLAIVRHLVELHGGTIRAESAGAGRGATFTLKLPIAPLRNDVERRRDRSAHRRPLDESLTDADLKGLRVLVVDDETDAREMIAAFLESQGATVDVAAGAGEALEIFARNPPSLILADIGMPGEDGYTLIHRIRERDGAVPVVALTAFARAEDRARALRAGFNLHLPKPVDVLELSAAIFRLTHSG